MADSAFKTVRRRIRDACAAAGRPAASVRLVAISKTQPADKIRYLHHLGQRRFGESYLDEATAKQAELTDLDIEWHFVGPIQSNKTRAIAAAFDWVHSVDRLKIVRRLADQRPADPKSRQVSRQEPLQGPLNVLIQVNLDDEPGKSGCAPDAIPELAAAVAEHERLTLRGLMAIPAPRERYPDQLRAFERLQALYAELESGHPGVDTLSAGMSADLEAAIAAGATMVRVGRGLFGARG